MTVIPIQTNSKTYEIQLGPGKLDDMLDQTARGFYQDPLVIVAERTVDGLYGGRAQAALASSGHRVMRVVHEGGEQNKTLESVRAILLDMFALGIDRSAMVVALGGGITGDMAGLAASLFMRGIPFLQVPTTLLAQVDASVGGKVGVNLPGVGKNMLGLFSQPERVIIDPEVLRTLPAREVSAGMAEAVKHAVLGDEAYFREIEESLESILALEGAALGRVIERSVRLKAGIVSRDEREKGPRALLNLGHTFAHALEAILPPNTLLHGEAVSVGLVAAARLAEERHGFPVKDRERIATLLTSLSLPTAWPAKADPAQALEALKKDKKFQSGHARIVLPKMLGEAVIDDGIEIAELSAFLSVLAAE